MTSIWKGVSTRGRVLKICHMSADSFVFKQKIYCPLLQMEWVGESRNWSFCGRHRCMTPKWFKITTNSIIRGSSFLFNIKPHIRDTFWMRSEEPPAHLPHSTLSPLHWWPNQSTCRHLTGGGVLPCSFSKIGKKGPNLDINFPDCDHLWVKFLI